MKKPYIEIDGGGCLLVAVGICLCSMFIGDNIENYFIIRAKEKEIELQIEQTKLQREREERGYTNIASRIYNTNLTSRSLEGRNEK